MRSRVVVAAAVTFLALAVGAALAAEPAPTQPGDTAGAPVQPEDTNLKQVQGMVDEVNVLERTIQVDGHAGQFPKTLVVGPETMVTLSDGRRASLADIREGDRVAVSYRELKDGNVAEEVRLTSPQEQAPSAAPSGPPGP